MSDDELDAAIAERFKAYEAGIRLPDEFKGRFIGSVRRKRTLRRLGLLGLIGAGGSFWSQWYGQIISAVIGAVVLIWIWHLIKKILK